MKTFISLFLLIMPVLSWADLSDLRLVTDTANKRVKSALLFLNDLRNLEMEASIINQMGAGVTYYVVKKPSIAIESLTSLIDPNLRPQVKIKVVDFNRCFTPWVQDYFMRMNNASGEPFLLPTQSQNLMLNDCRPFELGIADLLEKTWDHFQSLETIDYDQYQPKSKFFSLYRVDNRTGEMFPNSSSYRNMFPVRWFRYFYGEGGTRIATDDYILIERTELAKMLQIVQREWPKLTPAQTQIRLENLFHKKFIPIGTNLANGRFYVYHIDFFLSPVQTRTGLQIFLGHPKKTEEILGSDVKNMPGFDSGLWQEKITQANSIETELLSRGFRVQRVPIYFFKKNSSTRILTFSNSIQSLDKNGKPSAFVMDYDLDESTNVLIAKLKAAVQLTYNNAGLKLYFVRGGENFIDLNGQLRCSTGILSYER